MHGGRVEEYLSENESVEETVEIDTARVYVTNRRVLAFTPEIEGKNFKRVDRPNVTGVERRMDENRSLLWSGAQYTLLGALLTPVGFVLDFGSIFSDVDFGNDSTTTFGAGDLISAAETLIALFSLVGYALIAIGVLSLLGGLAMLAKFSLDREEILVLAVAGKQADDDVRLPLPDDEENGTETPGDSLERALFHGTSSPSQSRPGSGRSNQSP